LSALSALGGSAARAAVSGQCTGESDLVRGSAEAVVRGEARGKRGGVGVGASARVVHREGGRPREALRVRDVVVPQAEREPRARLVRPRIPDRRRQRARARFSE
jgi:hypothetical protein